MTTPSEEIVELQGGKWKSRVLSAGEGDPVVFLHGEGGLSWDPFLDGLAEGRTVIAPEHLGSGTSQGVEHLQDMLDLVLYYCELFDALSLPAAPIIGHSFGGMVAAEIAAINPERVPKLVLIAPLGLWRDDHPIPDISTITAKQLPRMLFADPDGPENPYGNAFRAEATLLAKESQAQRSVNRRLHRRYRIASPAGPSAG